MAFLYIDVIDFSKPFYGNGQASVAATAVRVLGEQVVFVGPTSGRHKIGQWTNIEIFGKKIRFLPVVTVEQMKKNSLSKNFHSDNFNLVLSLAKHCAAVKSIGINSVFTRVYTVLWWLSVMKNKWNICFYFPGLGNPLLVGRKPKIGRCLAPIYEILQSCMIKKAAVAFAAASPEEVEKYNKFLRSLRIEKKVFTLPIGVNLDIFKPLEINKSREILGLPLNENIYIYVGRLAAVKGLPFIIDAFEECRRKKPNIKLLIVGDGEQKKYLQNKVRKKGLGDSVMFLGMLSPKKVAKAITAANVCVVGSYVEGFSNAMVEQIACGRPVVSTDVSGARDIIKDGKNGYILKSRDHKLFAKRMIEAINLNGAEKISRSLAEEKYCEKNIWAKVNEMWPGAFNIKN